MSVDSDNQQQVADFVTDWCRIRSDYRTGVPEMMNEYRRWYAAAHPTGAMMDSDTFRGWMSRYSGVTLENGHVSYGGILLLSPGQRANER